ncbi:MAG: MFS transporter [Armatimonadetes bacterium]|nr:MFS transporter [Armatimonadota bacterium]
MLEAFAPPPPREVHFETEQQMRATYRYWRVRQLYATFVGYAVFYFVRKNIPLAIPVMEGELGYKKADLGIILTLHDLTYGVSKFVNGVLGDRSNPRWFMAMGLLFSAVVNVFFGMSSALWTLGLWWITNAWFQGMGFPPCARILANWFAPRERGTYWGIWNTSHQIGGAVILALAGVIAVNYGWRAVFYIPAGIAMVCALFLANRLRDTPPSLGLPPVETYTGDRPLSGDTHEDMSRAEFFDFLKRHVFSNLTIWMACVANFFVYVVRYGFFNWAPAYLHQARHVPLDRAGAMMAAFEIAGLFGSLAAGWITDRYFQARRGPVCVYYMLATAAAVYIFWKLPPGHLFLDGVLLFAVGFLIYGPQFLVGVMTADQATRRAAATAIGMTGFFGYLSGVISGWGLGSIVDRYGWDGAFMLLTACSLAAAVPFAVTWNARPAQEL